MWRNFLVSIVVYAIIIGSAAAFSPLSPTPASTLRSHREALCGRTPVNFRMGAEETINRKPSKMKALFGKVAAISAACTVALSSHAAAANVLLAPKQQPAGTVQPSLQSLGRGKTAVYSEYWHNTQRMCGKYAPVILSHAGVAGIAYCVGMSRGESQSNKDVELQLLEETLRLEAEQRKMEYEQHLSLDRKKYEQFKYQNIVNMSKAMIGGLSSLKHVKPEIIEKLQHDADEAQKKLDEMQDYDGEAQIWLEEMD